MYLRFEPCHVEICSWSPEEWLARTGHSAEKYGDWLPLQRSSCKQCVELSGGSYSVACPDELQLCNILLSKVATGGHKPMSKAAGLESDVDELREEQVVKLP